MNVEFDSKVSQTVVFDVGINLKVEFDTSIAQEIVLDVEVELL